MQGTGLREHQNELLSLVRFLTQNTFLYQGQTELRNQRGASVWSVNSTSIRRNLSYC